MTLQKTLLTWMSKEERTVGYVSRTAGIASERLIDLLAAAVAPTDDELDALATATGLPADDLRGDAEVTGDLATDPLRCYTVAEAASILQVSQDTVRKEIRSRLLHHVVLGERALRIPRYAIEDRLAGRMPFHREGARGNGAQPTENRLPANTASGRAGPRVVHDQRTPLQLL